MADAAVNSWLPATRRGEGGQPARLRWCEDRCLPLENDLFVSMLPGDIHSKGVFREIRERLAPKVIPVVDSHRGRAPTYGDHKPLSATGPPLTARERHRGSTTRVHPGESPERFQEWETGCQETLATNRRDAMEALPWRGGTSPGRRPSEGDGPGHGKGGLVPLFCGSDRTGNGMRGPPCGRWWSSSPTRETPAAGGPGEGDGRRTCGFP